MNALFKKLNFKEHNQIVVINSPESFEKELIEIKNLAKIKKELKNASKIEFILIFVTRKNEINKIIAKIDKLIIDDATLWFAYPKGTSKNYKCDFNRDTGWDALGKHGFEGVRIVAIDKDWSALRFRKVKHIKKMSRTKSMALTNEGKFKTTGK